MLLFVASKSINAQAPPRTVQDGVYSDAQAARGQALYVKRCAGCHGPSLEGAQAPALAGQAFTTKFRMEPLSALFIKIRYTMPPLPSPNAVPQPPSPADPKPAATTPVAPRLTPQEGADLVAHVLKSNGFPAGQADFAANDATTSQVGWPAASAGTTSDFTKYPSTGTVNQLMRGIFFPNSNLIFTIQELEAKDLPPAPPASRPDGLTIFDWGQLIYTGWPAVENSAAALADASLLLTQPGLRCENGRAAPVTEPDWIRFTDRMVSVAKRAYRLAQTQDKEALSAYTLDLSNACNACHGVYRADGGGRGRGRGGNVPAGGGRCVHR
jgi:mono/diheme cytochrome c family protein